MESLKSLPIKKFLQLTFSKNISLVALSDLWSIQPWKKFADSNFRSKDTGATSNRKGFSRCACKQPECETLNRRNYINMHLLGIVCAVYVVCDFNIKKRLLYFCLLRPGSPLRKRACGSLRHPVSRAKRGVCAQASHDWAAGCLPNVHGHPLEYIIKSGHVRRGALQWLHKFNFMLATSSRGILK